MPVRRSSPGWRTRCAPTSSTSAGCSTAPMVPTSPAPTHRSHGGRPGAVLGRRVRRRSPGRPRGPAEPRPRLPLRDKARRHAANEAPYRQRVARRVRFLARGRKVERQHDVDPGTQPPRQLTCGRTRGTLGTGSPGKANRGVGRDRQVERPGWLGRSDPSGLLPRVRLPGFESIVARFGGKERFNGMVRDLLCFDYHEEWVARS